MKLLHVDTVEQARDKVKAVLSEKGMEVLECGLTEALGKVLAEDIYAGEPVPAFRRSTVDGYAVRHQDTGGASESLPVFLNITGEVVMGQEALTAVHPGECVYVPTGGMLPEGADAMVMVEYCELFSKKEAAIYQSVPQGANVVQPGDDMKTGELVLPRGTLLRAQEIGALAALGKTKIQVYKPWSITVISTGDELAAPGEILRPGQVRDINTYSLCAQAERMGFEVREHFVLKDDRTLLRDTIRKAMEHSDIVAVSGGSSQGKKDETNSVIAELASEGAFTHGLALKPGKPTILGYDRPSGTLLAGLPGHPTAAMLVFELVIGAVWRMLCGVKEPFPVQAKMLTNLPAAAGRKTCQLVQLCTDEDGEMLAVPVFGRSGLITVLTKADGYVIIEENQEGLKKGEKTKVHLI